MRLKILNSRLLCLLAITTLALISCQTQSMSKKSTPELILRLSVQDSLAGGSLANVEFEISPGWHIYGPQLQKNGRPTSLTFSQAGKPLAPPLWPEVSSFEEGKSGSSLGYSGIINVRAPIDPSLNEVQASISWVACAHICVPGETVLKLTF